jgi:sulfatase maturation enzyme AslB (radical SAM superfamily)
MNNLIVPDWYCANIHAGLKIKIDSKTGDFLVSTCAKTPVVFNVGDNQTFNHPELIKFRNINQQEKILPGRCSSCHPNIFQIGFNRKSSNDLYIKDRLLYNQTGPKIITFLVSVLCNLACTTCSSSVSSKWASVSNNPNNFSSVDSDKLRAMIRNIDITNLETVHIYGGEPFLDPINNIILEELAEYGKNITIWYDTNGTIIPNDQTLALWNKFKLIRIKFSIDGVGDSFEYLRWPANWKKVTKNIITIKNTVPSNVMFGFRPAIGLLNLHKIKDIRDWFNSELSTNREGDLSEFEYNGVYGIFSATNMPEDMKDELLQIYDRQDPVMRIIDSWNKQPAVETVNAIKEKLSRIDQLRKTDYKKSLPYLNKYFK